jgi:hypothetical protein
MKKLLTTAAVLATLTMPATAGEWWTNKEPYDRRTECVRAGTDLGVIMVHKRVPFKSPADLFEAAQGWGFLQPKLIDNGDEVIVVAVSPEDFEGYLQDKENGDPAPLSLELDAQKYHFYRTQEACEASRKAWNDKWEAERRRTSEAAEKRARALDKYR